MRADERLSLAQAYRQIDQMGSRLIEDTGDPHTVMFEMPSELSAEDGRDRVHELLGAMTMAADRTFHTTLLGAARRA